MAIDTGFDSVAEGVCTGSLPLTIVPDEDGVGAVSSTFAVEP